MKKITLSCEKDMKQKYPGKIPQIFASGFISTKIYGIFRSELIDGVCQTPEIAIRMAAHPFVAPDESFIIFDKYSFSNGVQTSKLYASFKQENGQWSEPIEFREEINATGTELIPKVSPDGYYLFFQRKVNGNTDIYWIDAEVIDDLKRKIFQKQFICLETIPDQSS
jgi:hypothetical protein